jgi:hypothetical protein
MSVARRKGEQKRCGSQPMKDSNVFHLFPLKSFFIRPINYYLTIAELAKQANPFLFGVV